MLQLCTGHASTDRTARVLLVVVLLCAAVSAVAAQTPELPPGFFATPDPFTVSLRDARIAVGLMQRQQFLVHVAPDGERSIVAVRTVRAEYIETRDDLPVGHRWRYRVLVNDEPLDWDASYIEFDRQLWNMRALFTYRNQLPLPDVPFVLDGA